MHTWKEKGRAGKHFRPGQMTGAMLVQYIMALVGVAMLVFVAGVLSWRVRNYLGNREMYNWVYRALQWMSDQVLLVILALCLGGWAIVTYHYLARPIRYLDEMTKAAEQLIEKPEKPVSLPYALRGEEALLNELREKSLHRAEQKRQDATLDTRHLHELARSAGMAAQELIREVDRQARNGDVPEQQTVEKARWIEGQIRMLYDLTAEPEQENVNASSSR